jgi:hypothetical protein
LFPRNWVLPRKSTDVLEADLAWQRQIRDALPLERDWLYLAVVDPRSNLCYFNCSRGRQNKKEPLQ